MDQFIKENGEMDITKVEASFNTQMVINILVILRRDSNKDLVDIFIPMVLPLRDNLKKV